MDRKELLIDWLKDAYAMEKTAHDILKRQLSRTEEWPVLHDKILEHLGVTESQAERIEQCLEQLGSSPSRVKEGMGRFIGNVQAMSNALAGDEVVKNSIADYVFEQLEIASYSALISVARDAGFEAVAKVCEEILEEEEEMAAWLDEHLPEVVDEFVQRETASAAE